MFGEDRSAKHMFGVGVDGAYYAFPFGPNGKARRFRSEQDYLRARNSYGKVIIAAVVGSLIVLKIYSDSGVFAGLLGMAGLIACWYIYCFKVMLRNTVPVDGKVQLADR